MKALFTTLFFFAFLVVINAQTVDYSTGKVARMQGLYCFTDAEPLAPYDYLGTVDIKRLGAFKSPQYTIIRDALLKELKKEFPQADGVIFHFVAGAADKADAIKFKAHNGQ